MLSVLSLLHARAAALEQRLGMDGGHTTQQNAQDILNTLIKRNEYTEEERRKFIKDNPRRIENFKYTMSNRINAEALTEIEVIKEVLSITYGIAIMRLKENSPQKLRNRVCVFHFFFFFNGRGILFIQTNDMFRNIQDCYQVHFSTQPEMIQKLREWLNHEITTEELQSYMIQLPSPPPPYIHAHMLPLQQRLGMDGGNVSIILAAGEQAQGYLDDQIQKTKLNEEEKRRFITDDPEYVKSFENKMLNILNAETLTEIDVMKGVLSIVYGKVIMMLKKKSPEKLANRACIFHFFLFRSGVHSFFIQTNDMFRNILDCYEIKSFTHPGMIPELRKWMNHEITTEEVQGYMHSL